MRPERRDVFFASKPHNQHMELNSNPAWGCAFLTQNIPKEFRLQRIAL